MEEFYGFFRLRGLGLHGLGRLQLALPGDFNAAGRGRRFVRRGGLHAEGVGAGVGHQGPAAAHAFAQQIIGGGAHGVSRG
ncbi:hypothetical protein [Chromobacterium piscinae]|uniref:hypothetical protein n=1 Tax=Chromobacterium piscinae TaxID=686831 RepID=UPI00326036FF